MDPFQLFTTTNYTFLQLDSKSGGNVIVEEFSANGIVKLRDGMIQTDNMEQREATSSIHIRPDEEFIDEVDGNLVGHGVRVTKNGQTLVYRIESQFEGFDFDEDSLMFYRVTLKPEELWDQDASSLPLE